MVLRVTTAKWPLNCCVTVEDSLELKTKMKKINRWLSLHLEFIGYDNKLVPTVNEVNKSLRRLKFIKP